jgi:hypothetical protein
MLRYGNGPEVCYCTEVGTTEDRQYSVTPLIDRARVTGLLIGLACLTTLTVPRLPSRSANHSVSGNKNGGNTAISGQNRRLWVLKPPPKLI